MSAIKNYANGLRSKIFSADSVGKLEAALNDWYANNPKAFVQTVDYSCNHAGNGGYAPDYSLVIHYMI